MLPFCSVQDLRVEPIVSHPISEEFLYNPSIMKHGTGKPKGKGKKSVSHAKATRDEINGLMDTVKEFNAKSLEGAKKAAHNDDKLTKLGAFPAKQQKMPYAMRLGLNAAKKSREKKVIELAKEAQIQLPTTHVHKQNPSKKRRK